MMVTGHCHTLIRRENASTGGVRLGTDVVDTLGQTQHLLHLAAGGHEPEAGAEGGHQEAVVRHQAQHQGLLTH